MSDLIERLRHWQENCNDEYMHELAGRAADRIEALEAQVTEIPCGRYERLIEELKAKLDAVLNCKEVMWKRMDGKYEPYFLRADVLKALQEQEDG